MACRCAERRAAILSAARKPSTALTAAKMVATTSAQDLAAVTREGTARVLQRLQSRGKST